MNGLKSKLKAISTILLNNRLKDYEKIIRLALKNGYQVISLRDYVRKNFDRTKKVLVLRHDIDWKSAATYKMFAIEKKYRVKSSYYFRNSTPDPLLIKLIEDYGSEASLHFETIADFIQSRNIKTKEELLKLDFRAICLKILRNEIENFKFLYNVPCETIAAHGHPLNKKFGFPNNLLTEETGSYEFLGIKLEAYDKDFSENTITCYLSDCGHLDTDEGFRYGKTPVHAINNNDKFILFLSHPNHWYFGGSQKIKKIKNCILNRNKKG